MTEVLLTIIILVQFGYWIYRERLASEEKKKLINALVSKSPEDLVALDATDKLKVGEIEPTQPDLTSLDEVTQEVWEDAVLGDGKQ